MNRLLCVLPQQGTVPGLPESRHALDHARDLKHALEQLKSARSGTYKLAVVAESELGEGSEAVLEELGQRLPVLLLAEKSAAEHAASFDAVVLGEPSSEEMTLRVREATERWSRSEKQRLWSGIHGASEVARGAAHDFNNLLTVILGNLELVHMNADDPTVKALADSAIERAELGSRLTERLGLLSCPSGEPSAEDLNDLVRRYADIARERLPEGLKIETALDRGPIAIHVNKRRFEKALDLILDNACDAMPEDAVVTLVTAGKGEPITPSATTRVADKVPSEPATLEVRDHGHGMNGETLDRAFDLFYGTRERGRSGGVGLAIARACMQTDGAALAIRSEEGAGTSVFCLFPGAEDSIDKREHGSD